MRVLFDFLELIESQAGSNNKKLTLAEICKSKNRKEIIRKALDPRFSMHLEKGSKFSPFDPECDEHDSLSMNLVMQHLHSGTIVQGGYAIRIVSGVIGSFPLYDEGHIRRQAAKWVPRLVTKDLQIGISWKHFLEVNNLEIIKYKKVPDRVKMDAILASTDDESYERELRGSMEDLGFWVEETA